MPKRRSPGDGALYQIRGGKLWRGVVNGGYDSEGKRIQHYVHSVSKVKCRDKMDALKREIAENGAPVNRTARVADWGPIWLETIVKPNVDPSTYKGYRTSLTKRIVPVIGRKRVASLTPADVRAVHAAARTQGVSSSTLRQTHVALSLMLEAARKQGLATKNVAADVVTPKQASPERAAFTTEQALRILEEAAKLPDYAGSRWWFKLLAGARQTEILGAEITNFLPEVGIYDLAWKLEELTKQHGCGAVGEDGRFPCGYKRAAACPTGMFEVPDGYLMKHLEGRWHLTRPKSDKPRAVPIIPQLSAAISAHIEATRDWPNPHGLIWRNPDGSVIGPKQDQQEWRELLHAAGIIDADQLRPGGTKLTGHIARHTTVTVLAEWGVDFQIIGEIVGHSTAEVTKIYRHANRAEKMRAAQLLGEAWGAALPQIEG